GRCRWVTPLLGEIQDVNLEAGWLVVRSGNMDSHPVASERGPVRGIYQPSTGRRLPLPTSVNAESAGAGTAEAESAEAGTATWRPLERWLTSFSRDAGVPPSVPNAAPGQKSRPAPRPAIAVAQAAGSTWRLLVSDAAQDRLLEIDPRGQVVATKTGIAGPGPCCVGSDGSRWVVSHGELSLWQYSPGSDRPRIDRLPARPASVDALSDGGLLLSFPACRLVAEWQRDRGWGWSTRLTGTPVDAQRLASGRTRVTLIDDRRVVDVDDTGQQVWESSDLAQPRFGRRLPSGRTLIVGWSGSGVLGEWDEAGREMVWSRIAPQPVFAALRLPDQQLAVADANGLQLLSSTGQTIWKMDGLLVTGLSVSNE
ncbi:MAG: hypothetical protein ACKOBW_12805, partial [Planctomycetota bacterium]